MRTLKEVAVEGENVTKKFTIRYNSDQRRWNQNVCKEKFHTCDSETLCLWIADSDIPLSDEINEYILNRAKYPYYGYNIVEEQFQISFLNYNKKFRKQNIEFSDVFFTPGTVYSYATALQALTKEGDAVLFNIPVYAPLVHMAEVWKRNKVLVPYKNIDERFYFDYEKMEDEIKKNNVKLFSIVSPLNPSGRVWERDELLEIVNLCKKYDVAIISDEIHCDIVFDRNKFTSLLEFSDIYDKIVVVTSVNKTFNIAGLQSGWGITKNKELMQKIQGILDLNHIYDAPNIFAQYAMLGCFEKGEKFYKDSMSLYETNIEYVESYFNKNCPQLRLMKPDATFLPYVCYKQTKIPREKMKDLLWKEAKVLVHFADDFVDESFGENFRLNVATPFEVIEEACKRIVEVVNKNIN